MWMWYARDGLCSRDDPDGRDGGEEERKEGRKEEWEGGVSGMYINEVEYSL
jgi:hypothetical protein